MLRGGNHNRALVLIGAFAFIALGLTAWVTTNDRSTGLPLPRASTERRGEGDLASGTARDVAQSTRTAEVATTQQAEGERAEYATGRLHIHCVDETTGEDLPGLTWVVASERGGNKTHGTGLTDAKGRAFVEKLPENTILVFTLRQPPHAEAFTAVWLPRGASKDVELRVGAGARLRGRVVDDGGGPLEHVDVLVGDDYAPPFLPFEHASSSRKVAARTDAEGRYVVENVAARPRAVWIEDGEPRPESWSEVTLVARIDNATAEATTAIRPGETKDLPDLVLPRLRTWRGRVVDAGDRGVEGALLTLNWLRGGRRPGGSGTASAIALPPGSDRFELAQGETITGRSGAFEVSSRQPPQWPQVIDPLGVGQRVQLPVLEPGETANDVLVRLDDVSGVVVELVDAQGKRVRVPNPRIYEPDTSTRPGRRRFLERFRMSFSRSDGSRVRADVSDDGTGGFIAQIAGGLEDVRSYSVVAQGWEPVHAELIEPLRNGGRLRVQVEDQACVRVHLKLHGRLKPELPKSDAWVTLHACLLPLDPQTSKSPVCCGLGSSTSVRILDGERDVLLPVEAHRPFHVYSRLDTLGRPGAIVDEGMFAPDGSVLTLECDADDARRANEVLAEGPKPVSSSAAEKSVGSLRATVVDAVTGKPISEPDIDLSARVAGELSQFWVRSTAKNCVTNDKVPTGTWRARVTAKGYKEAAELTLEIRRGETTDLGRIALVPCPRTKLVILESDGSPIRQGGGVVRIRDADSGLTLDTKTIESSDGSVVSFLDLPERLLVQVQENDTDAQWVPVVLSGEATLVQLAAWRDVDVRVVGEAVTYPGSNLFIRVRPENESTSAFATTGPGRQRLMFAELRELDVSAGEPRLFRGKLAAGRYVVEGQSPLFQVSARAFEVGAGDGPVRVDVESTE